MVFIDHQAAIMAGIGDIDPVRFRNNVLALAKIAKLHGIPTVLSDNMPEGFAGPLLPELVALVPDAPIIHRDGPINAWDDPAFVAAIEATGRRKLVIAGCTTDICLMFPALSALAAGYDVYGVIDASGTWSELDQRIAVQRLVHAGVVVMNTANVLTELQYNHRKATDGGSGVLFADLVPQLAYTDALLRGRAVPA
ncbi:MAG TPA: isochorismatase family protein [Gemmatimonadales bacterium]|jgi:nicotinamidase-related amidase